MRLSPARRMSGPRQALVALVVGVLLFSGAPLAAWSAPTPTPTPTDSVKAQDEAAKDAKETPGDDETPAADETPADDETPAAEKTPSDDESPSDEALGRTDREGRAVCHSRRFRVTQR